VGRLAKAGRRSSGVAANLTDCGLQMPMNFIPILGSEDVNEFSAREL